jgi:hypothetical protein
MFAHLHLIIPHLELLDVTLYFDKNSISLVDLVSFSVKMKTLLRLFDDLVENLISFTVTHYDGPVFVLFLFDDQSPFLTYLTELGLAIYF